MFNKNRIRLFIALAVILIVGFFLVINNLRPVSERKATGREKLDTKKELQKINNRIAVLSDSIVKFPGEALLYYKRAGLYKSINKYEKAIEDYEYFVENAENQDVKTKAIKELESAKQVQRFLEKQKN